MAFDLAFKPGPGGRLIFDKTAQGDYLLDERATYAVVASLQAEKGKYNNYEVGYGTSFYTITRDGRATGSRYGAAITDAMRQCVRAGFIRSGDGAADRLRSGAWTLTLSWVTGAGAVTLPVSTSSANAGNFQPGGLTSAVIACFPAGLDRAIDWSGSPGRHIEAHANTLQLGFDAIESLANAVTPITAPTWRCTDWERTLGLARSKASTFGTRSDRQAAIISRLRERGATTRRLIQAVLSPILGYANPADLVVLGTDRTALRTLHSYPAGTLLPLTLPVANIDFHVPDDARVSVSGVQVNLTLTTTALEDITCALITPDGSSYLPHSQVIGSGAVTDATFRLYFKLAAGEAISTTGMAGTFSLVISGSGTVSGAALFTEGFGRDSTKSDGLSASVFYYIVIFEQAKSSGSYDLVAAAAALARINHATRRGYLGVSMDDGTLYALASDAACVADGCAAA